MKMLTTTILCATCATIALSAHPAAAAVEIAHHDAAQLALAETSSSRTAAAFCRYVWIDDGSKRDGSAVMWAMNAAMSRSTTIVHPELLSGGRVQRWDMRRLAPDDDDLLELLELWDSKFLPIEPYFHVTLFENEKRTERVKITVPRYRARNPDGTITWYDWKWEDREIPASGTVRDWSLHVGKNLALSLSQFTESEVPIVRHDWLLNYLLSTLDGGLYYEFRGIKRNPSNPTNGNGATTNTAQDAFLASLGASVSQVAALRSDERAAIFRSGVSGKERRIDVFYGVGVRPSQGIPLVTLTHDIFDEDRDPNRSPIYNLLDFEDRAVEAIGLLPNGLQVYALFNDRGELQDSVPDNIAIDHTIPASVGTARLQPGISCIRCHGPHDGYQPFQNDVQTLLAGTLDVFDDAGDPRLGVDDALDRLAGLYSGDLSEPIRQARNGYSLATYRASGGMTVPQVSLAVSEVYQRYAYDQVTTAQACRDLGYVVEEGPEAVRRFQELLPHLPANLDGIALEDPIIGALRVGMPVSRKNWEHVFADASVRSIAAMSGREEQGEQQQQQQPNQPQQGERTQ